MRRVLQVAGILMLVAASCSRHSQESLQRIDFRTGSGVVATGPLPVADTDAEREEGLMNVAHLDPDEGMIFTFDGPTTSGFWMKDTLIPLSIAFWRSDGTVVDIIDMDALHDDPCPVYYPSAPYVGRPRDEPGMVQRHGVEIGDHVTGSSSALTTACSAPRSA